MIKTNKIYLQTFHIQTSEDKEKILKETRGNKTIYVLKKTIRIIADSSSETMYAGRKYRQTFSVWKGKKN